MKRKRRGGAPSSAVRRREYPRRTHVRPGGGQPPPPALTPAAGPGPDEPREAPAPPAPVLDELPPPVPAGPWLSWRGVCTLRPAADPGESALALIAIAALLART